MIKNSENRKTWPKDCVWPEPLWDGCGMHYDEELVGDAVDEDIRDLMDVKEYVDTLDEDGNSTADTPVHKPYLWEDYWDDGFDLQSWEDDLSEHMNLLKICDTRMGYSVQLDPTVAIRERIDYEFINENLLRQAFTRRAFALEYGCDGCMEELEFLGDSILNQIVTKEIMQEFSEVNAAKVGAPFYSRYDEGELSRLRTSFVSKEYLAQRAMILGLNQYILYGTGEEETESSCEDMIEALIGAVTIDSHWNMDIVEPIVLKLLDMQLEHPDQFLQKSYYDIFNTWHQKRYGMMPIYEIDRVMDHSANKRYHYNANIRFQIPENDQKLHTAQRLSADGETRSIARNEVAKRAYAFVVNHGLWMNLRDADVTPDRDNAINQLQELFQKKYVEQPIYTFESEPEGSGFTWRCDCLCNDVNGWGKSNTKTAAKKKAAYMVLVRLLDSAGINTADWSLGMYE